MSFLRPHPHRGDVIAAGAVPLSVAAILIELRMTQWSLGPRFVVVALLALLVFTLGWLAELEDPEPRPYHSVLLVAGLLPLVVALELLAEVLGASRPPGAGGVAWTFALEAVIAGLAARRANSGICTLIAALSAVIALEAFISWVFKPHGLGTFRAFLLISGLFLGAGAVRLRDGRRRHAVQLVNATGIVTLALALSFLLTALAAAALSRITAGFLPGPSTVAGFGWKLYVLAVGFGLIAYAAVDSEPGPAYVGAAVLTSFLLLVGLPIAERRTLVGWPLFLLGIGAIGLGIGLRPRHPLPPPPSTGSRSSEPPQTVPLRPEQRP
jgi:hypothetical protein